MTPHPEGRPAEGGAALPLLPGVPPPSRWFAPAVVLLLAAAVAAVYGQALSFPFLPLDDRSLLAENRSLRAGLSAEGLRYALATTEDAGWVPVTWLSRLLDATLFGGDPAGPHGVNVLLHGLNAALLFHALRRLTGRGAESALAAALFAVHPLQAEAVCWVTERKGLLAAAFSLATVLAWLRHAERGGRGRYAAVLLLFSLALLSKPSAVTLPAALLLLDAWPLGRLRPGGEGAGEDGSLPGCDRPPLPRRTFRSLLAAAAPLLLLSAAAGAFALHDEGGRGVVAGAEELPAAARAGTATLSVASQAAAFLLPSRLSVFYPHPGTLPAGEVAAAALLLAAATALAWRARRGRPYLAFGWGWFLVTIAPVSGLVQAGAQLRADRYAYLPLAGLCVAAAWGAADGARRLRLPRTASVAFAAAVLLALAARAHGQASLWGDPAALFRRSLAVTEGNWLLHDALGNVELEGGRPGEAARHFREALRLRPGRGDGHASLGSALFRAGRPDEAEGEFREALRLDPGSARSRNNLGLLLAARGRPGEAEGEYREALRLRPGYGEAAHNLGTLLLGQGRVDEAEGLLREALRASPDDAEGHNNLGALLARGGREEEAERHFREALRLRPAYPGARGNLGLLLLRRGRAAEAEGELREAVRLDPASPDGRNNLGTLLASLGRGAEAEEQFREALRRDPRHAAARANLERLRGGGAPPPRGETRQGR